ncbi:MAG TPA: alpha-L-arabinofuranosidase C-terminal domain-containing protein [Calditrichia bacterium]|nr:carbohydrate binding domain-containing protein [Calditrichota bacterium]HQV31726.1 alpha-L-arabinofuranosidase C-terminal domain-containing protein [Calditrichia bacterium]
MNARKSGGSIAILLFLLIPVLLLGKDPRITVNVAKTTAEISPEMYGIFFEDINFGADGGLYAELVKNRSFEFDRPLRGWQVLKKDGAVGRVLVLRDDANRPRNPRVAHLKIENGGAGFGLVNEGFRGIGVKEGAKYDFSIEAKKVDGGITGITLKLVNDAGQTLAEGRVGGFEDGWKTYTCELTATASEAKARLELWFEGAGELQIDMVSLFPRDTWKGRKNGLRKDIVQLLADMKPGFLRFPGGCIVEGFDLSQRYQWKNTIGPVNERVQNINRWNFEFRHRYTPDYYQSYGLGYYEFFLLSEDLGAEPMPILTCGMACQFNTGELVPMDQLEEYVQDALDLIEFANGPADSKWGKVRAEMGHPEPFNMKMIGIGNEQWGPQYIERYKVFAKALKDKYPDIQLIAATGSDASIFPNGAEEIAYLWEQWRQLNPEFVDEHFYRQPDWFIENTGWYDQYPRKGPELFVGEYASQSVGVASPDNRNIWKCALYEAAFMTGMERNADLVRMTCYAPLLAHEDAWQWRPDMIWFDNLKAYGSANYQVQRLFSLNPGTHLLTAKVSDAPALDDKKAGLHASATLDKNAGEVIVKVVNATATPLSTEIDLKGAGKVGKNARMILLTSPSLDDENTIDHPEKIVPTTSSVSISGSKFQQQFAPYSLTILRIPVSTK